MQCSQRFSLLLVLVFAALLVGRGVPVLAQPPTAWVDRYNGRGNLEDYATDLAVDSAGNVYVTGYSNLSGIYGDYGYVTIKYDASGNVLWVARYDEGVAFDNTSDFDPALAVDATGNVYVTGTSFGGYGSGTGYDYATIKYDAAGNELWVRRYNGPGNSSDRASALAVDASGNVYVTGNSGGTGTGPDYATLKYDAAGTLLWGRRYNGPGNYTDSARALVVDADGNVYVTGPSYGPVSMDYATIKYDASGKELWVRRYTGSAVALAVDAFGNVYVTGYSGGDYGTIKYDAEGHQVWAARYTGNRTDSARALAVDDEGSVYVTGMSSGLGGWGEYATVKYDAAGNELWVRRHNGLGNGDDAARAIALDRSGNVYVTGSSPGPAAGISDYATIKYDTDGNELWVARYHTPGRPGFSSGSAIAVALDNAGNVYVTGTTTGSGTRGDYTTIKYAAVPNLRLTDTNQQRTDSAIELTLGLENRGDAAATAVQLTGATLQGVAAQGLPVSPGTIAAGGSATLTLRFAGSFPAGSRVLLQVRGRFAGGSLSASRLVTLP